MNLDHDFFQVSKLSEDQFPKFLWRPALKCTPKLNYWGDAGADYTQIIGEIQSNWGDISPHPGFGTPVGEKMKQRQTKVEETDLLETIIKVEAQNKA